MTTYLVYPGVHCFIEFSLFSTIRFSRLLHKKKFDEAEEFAKMFELDVQVNFFSYEYIIIGF